MCAVSKNSTVLRRGKAVRSRYCPATVRRHHMLKPLPRRSPPWWEGAPFSSVVKSGNLPEE